MGCCNSTPADPSPPPSARPSSPPPAATTSALPPAPPSPRLRPRPRRTPSQVLRRARRRTLAAEAAASLRAQSSAAPATLYNMPLVRRPWRSIAASSACTAALAALSPSRPRRRWSAALIDRYRAEFFDTRVSGQPELWQALHAALALLWAADREPDADRRVTALAEAMPTAQGILDAVGITLPTGNLLHGAYDSRGNMYQVCEAVICDPLDMAAHDGEDTDADSDSDSDSDTDADTDAADATDADEETAMLPATAVATAATPADQQITVTARLSEGARDVAVVLGRNDPVRVLRRLVHAQAGLAAERSVRVIYMGRALKESETLMGQGWREGHVVNALVLGRR